MNTNKDKDLKNRIRYSSSFDIELLDGIKKLSKETDIPVSKLLDQGMRLILEKYNKGEKK